MNAEKNAHFIRSMALPQHLLDLKQKWEREEAEKQELKLYQQSLVKVRMCAMNLNLMADHP